MQLIRENSFQIRELLLKASDPSHVDDVAWSLNQEGTVFSATFTCERFASCTVSFAVEDGQASEIRLEEAARLVSEEFENRLCTMGNLAVFGMDPGLEAPEAPEGVTLVFVYEDEDPALDDEPLLRATA